MRSVDIEAFLEVLEEGAAAFDVRTQAQHQRDGLPGTEVLSLEDVQAGELPDVPKERPVYLICERGQVSELAGLYLEAAGFQEVYNVAGGMKVWRKDQQRVESNEQ